jgi:CBS domain-containing protein
MARNWCASLQTWTGRFHDWIETPNSQALLEAAIFFDFRQAHGDLDLGAMDAAVRRARQARTFVAAMAKAALEFTPPSGLRLRFGTDTDIDLKFRGISPIVFLARCYAIEVGAQERNTLERLDAVARAGLIGEDRRQTIREAYRFLLALRLREQIRMISEGKPPTNRIHLESLSSMERSRLKDTFREIRTWQEKAAFHYRTDLF